MAGEYERGRPGYPREAIDWLLGSDPLDVLDVGAGTGKLTYALSHAGHRVIAVEPLGEMRELLSARLPAVRALAGSAERLPLEDASVDAVTVGAAFHWFDQGAALAEVARVLRPGGVLGLLGNAFDPSQPWVARVREILGPPAIERRGHWPSVVDLEERFAAVADREFPHEQCIDREVLRDLAELAQQPRGAGPRRARAPSRATRSALGSGARARRADRCDVAVEDTSAALRPSALTQTGRFSTLVACAVMADTSTIASLATAAGTLVLAIATFSSTRSANRAARVSEQALRVGLRPVLFNARPQDPAQKVGFIDDHWLVLRDGLAAAQEVDANLYLAIPLRNVGSGLGVLHGWHLWPEHITGTTSPPAPEDFRRLQRDLYVPAGDISFWQAAIRDAEDPLHAPLRRAIQAREALSIDILYGDHEGGQRTITRFYLTPRTTDPDEQPGLWLCSTSRHWNLDRADPR